MDIREAWKREIGYTIRDIDTSANGEYILVGSFDHKVYLFDRKGNLLWDYLTGDTVRDVAISFDGKFIAAGSYDNSVYFFNTKGDLLWKFDTEKPVRDISISAGGEYLVVGSNDHHVYFLDRKGELLWKHRTGNSVIAVAQSMKGEYITIGSKDRHIYFFNRFGDLLWKHETGSVVQDVEMTTRGRYVAAGSFDKHLYFFDRNGKLLWKRKCESPLQKVAISPLGDQIAAGGEGEVVLYNQNGELQWRHATGEHEVRGLEISTQGGSIICGSRDNELLYFDRKGRVLWSFLTPQWVEAVAVGSRGRFITAGLRNGVLYLFDSLEFFKAYLEEARQSVVRLENFGTDNGKVKALYDTAMEELDKDNYMKALASAIRTISLSKDTIQRNRPVFSYMVRSDGPFKFNSWTPINVTIANTGKADAQDMMLKFHGPVRCRGDRKLPVLKADETRTIRIEMKPLNPGFHQIELDLSYFDFHGREYLEKDTTKIRVFDSTDVIGQEIPEGTSNQTMLFKKKVGLIGKDVSTLRSNPRCPNCNRESQMDWIACPYCATSLRL